MLRHVTVDRLVPTLALLCLIAAVTPADAVTRDNMTLVVDQTTGGTTSGIGAFGYDPTTDTIYIAGLGASQAIMRVSPVNGTQVATVMVGTNAWYMFMKDGHNNWQQGNPAPGSLLLNPQSIDASGLPAYSRAAMTDRVSVLKDAGNVPYPSLTQEVYLYNLGQAPTTLPPGYDGTDVFKSLITLQQLWDAITEPPGTTPNTSTLLNSQAAWSSDAESIYFCDKSAAYGGIWKVSAASGATARLQAMDVGTEPGVVHTSIRDFDKSNPTAGDQILFGGVAAGTYNNVGGIDYLLDSGTAVTGPHTLIPAAMMATYFEWNGKYLPRSESDGGDPGPGTEAPKTVDIRAIEPSNSADVYFYDWSSRGVWLCDAIGRVAAIKTRAQHTLWDVASGAASQVCNTFGMQRRNVTYTGAAGPYVIPQILFKASETGFAAVGGIYVFKVGDFNRDGVRDGADIVLFKTALNTPIRTFSTGVSPSRKFYEAPADGAGNELEVSNPAAYADYIKCDLNGNTLVTSADRVILDRFLVDTDGDNDVDLADFGSFQACFNGPNRPPRDPDRCWNTDYDMDGDVDLGDFGFFQSCFNGPNRPMKCL